MKTLASFPGGGFRGLAPARVVARLEEETGEPARELFSAFAGTSTGGLIAAALAVGVPAWRIQALYLSKGEEIFSASWLRKIGKLFGTVRGPKYSSKVLREELEILFGDRLLGDPDIHPLLLPAYDLQRGRAKFFKSYDPDDADIRLVDACMATTAAPWYFAPSEDYIDGGVHSNDPALCLLADARLMLWPGKISRLVSFGNGHKDPEIDPGAARRWGVVQWGRPIISILMDGSLDVVDYIADALLGSDYIHLRVPEGIPELAMDNASAAARIALVTAANEIIDSQEYARVLSWVSTA